MILPRLLPSRHACALGLIGLLAALPPLDAQTTFSSDTLIDADTAFSDNVTIAGSPRPTVTIAESATVTSTGGWGVGSGGVSATLVVHGALTAPSMGVHYGSLLDITGALTVTADSYFSIGYDSTGSLLIRDGGTLLKTVARTLRIGYATGAGSATITGTGSSLQAGDLAVGDIGSGTLTIADGGAVTTTSARLNLTLGGSTVTITGAGSTWTTNSFTVSSGDDHTNIVNLVDRGTLTIGSGSGSLVLAASSRTTINFGGAANAAAQAGGILNAASILSGGADTVQFNTTGTASTPFYLTKDGTATGAGVALAGNLSVIQTAGRNVLAGDNTFTGAIALNGGTLVLGSANAAGTGGTISFAGGALGFSSANTTDYSARFSTAAGQQYAFDTNGQDVTLASALTSDGGTLTKDGTGILRLTGQNTYAGGTTINAGVLELGSDSAIGTGTLTLNGGGVRAYWTGRTLANDVVVAGDFTLGRLTHLAGNIALHTDATITATNPDAQAPSSSTLSGPISGAHSLTFAEGANGIGTIHLTGVNTYTGGTVVNGGTVQLGNGGNHLADAGSVTVNGGVFRLGAANETIASLAGSGGTIDLYNGAGRTLTLAGSDTAASASAIIGNGARLVKAGSGTQTLGGASTYSGGTALDAGTLLVAHDSALGTGAIALNGGTLGASGGARTLANAFSLNADTTFTGGHRLELAGAGTLNGFKSITVAGGSTAAFGGALGESTFSVLIKQGGGTLELTGANTYTGGTAIGAGTVRINNATGSAFGTGAVTVAAGATLTGAGSFTGALQLNGTYSPGNSPGEQATGSQTWAGDATYVWEINDADGAAGSAYDLLSISGTLTIAATAENRFTLSLVSLTAANAAGLLAGFDAAQDYTYTIASASGGILGFDADKFTIDSSGFTNALDGGSWSLAVSGNDLNLNFAAASAIPEPSTYAVFFGLAALTAAAIRRRRLAAP